MTSSVAELERALGCAFAQQALHGVQCKPDFVSAILGHAHKQDAEKEQDLLKGLDEYEMRIDPDEKRVWTFAEYRANYANRYKLKDIIDYWRILCVPFKILGKNGREARGARSKSRMRSLARRSTVSIRVRSSSRRRARSRNRLANQRLTHAHGGSCSPDNTDEEVIETDEGKENIVAVPAPAGSEAAAAVAAARGRESELWALYARLSSEQAGRQRILDQLKQRVESISDTLSGNPDDIAGDTPTTAAHDEAGSPPVRRNVLLLYQQLLKEHAIMQKIIGDIVTELGGPMMVATTLGLWPPPEVLGTVNASERRVDPDLKQTWTFVEYYVGHLHAYKPVDIFDYWNAVCTPCDDDLGILQDTSSDGKADSAGEEQQSQVESDEKSADTEPQAYSPPIRGRAATPPPSRLSATCNRSASPSHSINEESDIENNPNVHNSPKRQSRCWKGDSALGLPEGYEGSDGKQVGSLG